MGVFILFSMKFYLHCCGKFCGSSSSVGPSTGCQRGQRRTTTWWSTTAGGLPTCDRIPLAARWLDAMQIPRGGETANLMRFFQSLVVSSWPQVDLNLLGFNMVDTFNTTSYKQCLVWSLLVFHSSYLVFAGETIPIVGVKTICCSSVHSPSWGDQRWRFRALLDHVDHQQLVISLCFPWNIWYSLLMISMISLSVVVKWIYFSDFRWTPGVFDQSTHTQKPGETWVKPWVVNG